VPATSWPEAAAKARYILNLYSADLAPADTYHRNLLVRCRSELPNWKHPMQNLSPRHVKTEESLRLGVVSGWYSTKVSGTFVSGPH